MRISNYRRDNRRVEAKLTMHAPVLYSSLQQSKGSMAYDEAYKIIEMY